MIRTVQRGRSVTPQEWKAVIAALQVPPQAVPRKRDALRERASVTIEQAIQDARSTRGFGGESRSDHLTPLESASSPPEQGETVTSDTRRHER
jgi:hypothetical protein